MIVAIDGPAGAGKTSVSVRVAERLGFIRLDTGALYRAVALAATNAGLTTESEGLETFVKQLDIEFRSHDVSLDGELLGARIRTQEMGTAASKFSAVPAVRAGLLGLQRHIGERQDAVVDGRDIGTVVFPHAALKVFLTASVEERARRRFNELRSAGLPADLDSVKDAIEARDNDDMNRPIAPLRQAADALLVDSTQLSIDDVVEIIVRTAIERMNGR